MDGGEKNSASKSTIEYSKYVSRMCFIFKR